MKIGINCQHMLLTPTGPVYHLIETVKALLKADSQNSYTLYFADNPSQKFLSTLIENNHNVEIKVLKKSVSWTHYQLATELFKNPPDVYFTSVHTVPFITPNKTKIVSMIHGVEYIQNAQYKGKPHLKLIHPIILWYLYKKSRSVVVPSLATKNDIEKRFKLIDKERMKVIKEGVNTNFYKSERQNYQPVLDKYNITQPYIYFISTIQPRKNIPKMVEGFKIATEKYNLQNNLTLVIAGKKGWEHEESLNSPTKYGIGDRVSFLGHIDNEDRPALLSGAKFFISPSLQEGFGLTLLEAIACGTPSLVSDIPAHKEVGKSYVRYFNPINAEDIAKEMKNMLENPITSQTLENGIKHSKKYSWEETAKEFIKVFNS